MKIVKKLYRFDCPECGNHLEASPKEVKLDKFGRLYFNCPVCKRIEISRISSTIVYDNDYVEMGS